MNWLPHFAGLRAGQRPFPTSGKGARAAANPAGWQVAVEVLWYFAAVLMGGWVADQSIPHCQL